MKGPDGILLYFDRLEALRELDDGELGKVFRAVWEYAESGTIPDLPKELQPFWKVLRPGVDSSRLAYQERCVKNRYNRSRGIKEQAMDEIWEWWARQPDYSTDLFKRESWYEEAAVERERFLTTVNDGQQSSRTVTNLTEPNTNPTLTEPNAHFADFWETYPRQERRSEAYEQYLSVLKEGEDPEIVLSAAREYARECKKDRRESKYIMFPKIFLSAARYRDYVRPPEPDDDGGNPYTKYLQ